MNSSIRRYAANLLAAIALGLTASASAWELSGTKTITLHARDGGKVPIGSVDFVPAGERVSFAVQLDPRRFKDFFLSMREFKCVPGTGEVHCHVPYPYDNPATVTATDLAWLEHALIFLYNVPRDYGAKLRNGLYYRFEVTDAGLIGKPQAIDLNLIAAPPEDSSRPPFNAEERVDIDPDARWFNQLTID